MVDSKESLEYLEANYIFWLQSYVEFLYKLEVINLQISKSYIITCKFKNRYLSPRYFY